MICALLNTVILQAQAPGGSAPTDSAGGANPAAPTDPSEFVREIARHWNGGGMVDLSAGVLVFAGVVLLVLALWMWKRHRGEDAPSRPMAVFRRVAGKVALSIGEQVLLTRIARQQKLPTPLTLLLSSGTLQHHGQRYAESLPESQRRNALARIARVGRKVFGDASGKT
jgi:hypothetical protein